MAILVYIMYHENNFASEACDALNYTNEAIGSEKHASKDESFKGCHQRHSVGTMEGARSNMHDIVTRPFPVQIESNTG